MTHRAAKPTQAQISRAIKAVQAAGLQVSAVEIDGTKIVVLTSSVGKETSQPKNAFDEWLKKRRKVEERKRDAPATRSKTA